LARFKDFHQKNQESLDKITKKAEAHTLANASVMEFGKPVADISIFQTGLEGAEKKPEKKPGEEPEKNPKPGKH